MSADGLPDVAVEAELDVLATCLKEPRQLDQVVTALPVDYLSTEVARGLYRTMLGLRDSGAPVEATAVLDKVIGNPLLVAGLQRLVVRPTVNDPLWYIREKIAPAATKNNAGTLGELLIGVRDSRVTDPDGLRVLLDRCRTFFDTIDAAPLRRRRLELESARNVPVRRVRWLWDTTPEDAPPTSEGRIPADSLTIGAGNPGTGKSQFAVWLTAAITTGTLDGELWGKPAGVMYATTEDDWSRTVAPRLIAAGADLDLVYRINVTDDQAASARLSLPVDTDLLGQAAEDNGVALLVLDPLLSHIDQAVNDYRAAEVRAAIEPLVAAAARHHLTIFGLAHFTKSGVADPLARVAGSGAFGQLIRCLIAFARKDGEDGQPSYILSVEKNNLGRTDLPGFAYRIQPVAIEAVDGTAHVSRFLLGERTTDTVASVMEDESRPGSREERTEAEQWLVEHLTEVGGADDSKSIRAAATKVGISKSALYRAKDRLGLRQQQLGYGTAKTGHWVLPGALANDEDPTHARERESWEN